MDTISFNIQSIASSVSHILILFFRHHIVWGFVLGLLTSTGIHAIVVSQNPREIPRMITRPASDSFQRIARRSKDGTFETSYSDFLQEHRRTRIVFYSLTVTFLAVIAIAIIRF